MGKGVEIESSAATIHFLASLVGHEEDRMTKSQLGQTAWLKEMKKRIEEEMLKKEIETILYWKGEMEKVLAKKQESLGAFQIEGQNIIQRMQNRLKVLKSSKV